jgi:hypothetical protein
VLAAEKALASFPASCCYHYPERPFGNRSGAARN